MTTPTKENLKVCDMSPQGYTGVAYYDHPFCLALHEKGVDVTWVTSAKLLVDPKIIPYTLKLFFVDTYGGRSRLKKGLAYLRGIIKTFFYVLFKRINVVHFQLLELPIVDAFLFFGLKICGVRVVYSPHDLISFKYGESKRLTNFLFWCSDVIIAHNRPNEEMLLEHFPHIRPKMAMIRQGNYNAFLNPNMTKADARKQINLPQDKKIILLFGNIRQGKGTLTGVRAFQKLKDKSNVRLVVAGRPNRGFDMSPIDELVAQDDMKDSVIYRTHFIEDEDVEAYYKASDMILVPYEKIYTSAVFAYAFSCQCTVVASDRKELLEYAQDRENCLVFKTGDSEDLALKIQTLLDDEELAKRIAKQAKHTADHDWDWAKTAETLIDIYTSNK